MPQFNWTYVNDAGKHHVVGLYHGQRSGHLMAHCNGQVVLVDFHVLQSKTYRLFIDDELFDLKLDRRDDKFIYTFEINKEADTPRNRRRRVRQRQHLRKGLIMLGGFLLLLTLTVAWLYGRQAGPLDHSTTLAQIQSVPEALHPYAPGEDRPRPVEVTYTFAADGEKVRGRATLPDDPHALMPLAPGDEFHVTYLSHRPEAHELDLRRPSRPLQARYRQMAIASYASAHPELDRAYIGCLVDRGFDLLGTDAFVAFYRAGTQGHEPTSPFQPRADDLIRRLKQAGLSCPQ